MARKKESLLHRITRHTRPDLLQFLDQGNKDCLEWRGAFSPKERKLVRWPRPHLKGFGNPVRALFAHIKKIEKLDRWCLLKNTCGDRRCINPLHYKAIAAFSTYHERRGTIPSDFDEAEIEALMRDQSLWEFASPRDLEEVKRRCAL